MPSTFTVSHSQVLAAAAEQVYAIIADYRDGHPHILPKPYFLNLAVEHGGIGAGSVIRFQMRIMGKTYDFHGTVAEPEPGRVLVEAYDHPAGNVTTFTVDPVEPQQTARVTIATEMPWKSGLRGRLERWLVMRLLRRIYTQELSLLEALAKARGTAANAS